MTSTPLDSLLATAQEYNASDLHIIAGVPPAFRVNGEIISPEPSVMQSLGERRRKNVTMKSPPPLALDPGRPGPDIFRCASPEGRCENSPAVHCRVTIPCSKSPEGTIECLGCQN